MRWLRPIMDYKLKEQQMEYDRADYQAWLTGMYVGNAMALAFGGGEYPEKPFSMQDIEVESNEEDLRKDDEIAAANFMEFANLFNRQRNEVDDG